VIHLFDIIHFLLTMLLTGIYTTKGETAFDIANSLGSWEVAHYLWCHGGGPEITIPSPHLKSKELIAEWSRPYIKGDLPYERQSASFVKFHPKEGEKSSLYLVGGYIRTYSDEPSPTLYSRPTSKVDCFYSKVLESDPDDRFTTQLTLNK